MKTGRGRGVEKMHRSKDIRKGKWKNESVSHSDMFNSLQPHGLQPSRLLCPWNSPGKNTEVDCHFLLLGLWLGIGLGLGLGFGSSQLRDWTQVSFIGRQILYHLSYQGAISKAWQHSTPPHQPKNLQNSLERHWAFGLVGLSLEWQFMPVYMLQVVGTSRLTSGKNNRITWCLQDWVLEPDFLLFSSALPSRNCVVFSQLLIHYEPQYSPLLNECDIGIYIPGSSWRFNETASLSVWYIVVILDIWKNKGKIKKI